MALENRWINYPPMNWFNLVDAIGHYKRCGYEYVEVPWAVSEQTAFMTMPKDATPIYWELNNERKILVGSAEQGFLEIRDTLKPNQLYCSVSPCFRGEKSVQPGFRQLTFMKVELFCLTEDKNIMFIMMRDALRFFYVKTRLEQLKTSNINADQCDIELKGKEIGSYGVRKVKNVSWAYGTGLAEPRFTELMKNEEK